MKTALIVVFVALFVISVECARANHKKHRGSKMEDEGLGSNEVGFQDNGDWPNPDSVSNFDVPPGFQDGSSADEGFQGFEEDGNSSSGRHHGKSHRHHRN